MKTRTKPAKKKPVKRATTSQAWHAAVVAGYAEFQRWPGVLSVSLGHKETGGRLTRKRSVKIYVQTKLPEKNLEHPPFPKTALVLLPIGKGLYRSRRIPTDVVEVRGFHYAGDSVGPFSVIPSGCQIGLLAASSGPGTHGCLVRRRTDGRQFLLTAGHVVSSTPGNVPPQRIVFQPKASSPNPALIVGPTVLGFIGNHVGAGGHMDAVLYDLNNPQRSATNESFTHLPAPTGILSVAATVQQRPAVLKVGAVTGQTLALFSTFHQRFDDPTTAQTFFNVMEFGLDPQNPPPNGRVADRGDSGALVISRSAGSTGLIVGLLFAVSMDFTRFLVVPFERIASFLQVDL